MINTGPSDTMWCHFHLLCSHCQSGSLRSQAKQCVMVHLHLQLTPPNAVPNGTQTTPCVTVTQEGKTSDLSVLHHSIPGGGRLDHMQVPEPNTSNQSSSPVFSRLELEGLETGNCVCHWLRLWHMVGILTEWRKEGMNQGTVIGTPCQPQSLFPRDEFSLQEPHFLFHRWRPPY